MRSFLGSPARRTAALKRRNTLVLLRRELLSNLVALRARPQQGVLALRELHLAKHGQHRAEDRDVAEPSRLRRATATTMDMDHTVDEIDVDPHEV